MTSEMIHCPACGSTYPWRRWDSRPAAAADVASSLSPDPERRAVSGFVVAASGLAPLAQGSACRVAFDESGVSLEAVSTGASVVVASIAYSAVDGLRVGGRGILTSTSGLGFIGGGFGVQGAVEGALVASALNALTTRTKTNIETLVTLNAGPRALVLLNTDTAPAALEARLAPAFVRFRDARRQAVADGANATDPVARLQSLADLHDRGALSDAEYEAAKRTVLGPPERA